MIAVFLNLKNEVSDLLLKLESRLTVMISKCIKSIPEYTYAELKELKNKGLLIPGQTYKMIDYEPTVSFYKDGLQGRIQAPSNVQAYIYLTALSSGSFYEHAYIEGDYHSHCDIFYRFDRCNDLYSWSFRPNEGYDFIAVDRDGNEMRINYAFGVEGDGSSTDKAGYSCNGSFVFIGSRIEVNKIITITPMDGTPYQVTVKEILDDKYRGLIYRYQDLQRNIDIPCDPTLLLNFTVNLPDGNTYDVTNREIYAHGSRNICIKPYYNKDDLSIIPRIYINGSTTSGQSASIYNIYIGENCSHIVTRYSTVLIRAYASHVYVYSSNLIAHGNSIGIEAINVDRFECGVDVINVRAKNLMECFIPTGNRRVGFKGVVTDTVSVKLLGSIFDSSEGTAFTEYSVEAQNFVYFGKDSNGNIRQWNPADFVDAVEPEDQAVEQSETVEE